MKILEQYGKTAPNALARALYEEGLALEAESTPRVPVDSGRLRATHFVSPPTQTGAGQVTVDVGYGTDYAVYVHERTEVRAYAKDEHGNKVEAYGPGKLLKFSAAGTGPKFLENAYHERLGGFSERLAKRTKRNIDQGLFTVALSPNVPPRPQDPGEITGVFGPSRRDMLRGQRAERRRRVLAKRRARRADRQWHKKAARAMRREQQRERRKAARAARKAMTRAKAQAKRVAKAAAKRKRNELRALTKLRNRMSRDYFDF